MGHWDSPRHSIYFASGPSTDRHYSFCHVTIRNRRLLPTILPDAGSAPAHQLCKSCALLIKLIGLILLFNLVQYISRTLYQLTGISPHQNWILLSSRVEANNLCFNSSELNSIQDDFLAVVGWSKTKAPTLCVEVLLLKTSTRLWLINVSFQLCPERKPIIANVAKTDSEAISPSKIVQLLLNSLSEHLNI